MPDPSRDGLLFRIDARVACSGPDGEAKWESAVEPLTVSYADLVDHPEFRAMADRIIEEGAADGRDERGA